MEANAGNVIGVSFESKDGIRVGRFNVVELDVEVPGGGEVALVGRNAETVDLGVGVLDCAGADA